MEALYSKLHKRYTKLKKEKECEFDNLTHDQEVKFMNYAAAADEMIRHLKSETDRLYGQVDELTKELASVRSSDNEQLETHFEKLWMEENQKNLKLTEELARLQGHNGCSLCAAHDRKIGPHDNSSDDSQDQHTYADKVNDASTKIQQPACCAREIYSSGSLEKAGAINCVFQELAELIHGLKLSLDTQINELCMLAHHTSSGYSFSLTWTTNSLGEPQLLYRVSSLGTIERIAPGWMKEEAIMFSPNMCSVFFDRICRVLKA